MVTFLFTLTKVGVAFLWHSEATVPLSWTTRMMIALGAAKGLAFLHNAERPVIYRDFKTSNILLDSVSICLNRSFKSLLVSSSLLIVEFFVPSNQC